MIEDNQEHSQTTEEDSERVEVVVGYHVFRGVGGGWGVVWMDSWIGAKGGIWFWGLEDGSR